MGVKAGHVTCRFLGLGAATLLAAAVQVAGARASDDRTISFYHIHTKETLTVAYKKNGRFVPDAMKKINWILRDWRKDQATTMDPNTIDIIWEMHRELGSQQPVHIISGYRSPSTNEMLRKTRGGQAKQSQHMTGKAIDIAFPDVPLRRMRYSAMIRERGGVGYYPTSGIPFVHVDTARVRHWPRMVRDELALLFPSGRSKHEPADGRPITLSDVRAARQRRQDLAQEVAQFYALRDGPKAPIQVAEASAAKPDPLPVPPRPAPAERPAAPRQPVAVAALAEPTHIPFEIKPAVDQAPPEARVALAKAVTESEPAVQQPKLLSAPKPVDRPSTFVAKLPDTDRSRLDMLVKLASLDAEAPPAVKPAALITGSTPMKASLAPEWPFSAKKPVTEAAVPPPAEPEHPFADGVSDWRSGWTTAPEYDDDHPDELSYRPFALAPLLTETPSFDDPALATLVHPDAAQAIDMLDDEGTVLPMRFGTGQLQTAMAWAQEFKGDAVYLEALAHEVPPETSRPQLVSRAVKTLPR
ncbi:DUF882 domain-containing protein [Hyphomicrobium sp.]|uniref:DUF882 domain-containing protein n=1 Tax=Hyphomicrobium sp. TaxID=82 RepID=UPI0025BA36D5|nr:DUF882 domain-containing protein [Hyphomicrobium sp.]MCC7251982.1 DUF882 domain-containing protein [Hyphomicrobium sp.]